MGLIHIADEREAKSNASHTAEVGVTDANILSGRDNNYAFWKRLGT